MAEHACTGGGIVPPVVVFAPDEGIDMVYQMRATMSVQVTFN